MSLSAKLGYVFIAPALVLVAVFFFDTSRTDGDLLLHKHEYSHWNYRWCLSNYPSLLRDLSGKGFEKKTLDAIGAESYQVSQATLQVAREAGSSPDLLTELEEDHLGSSFKNRREFERFLKKLQNRPRSTRELKSTSPHFKKSLINERFETEADLRNSLVEMQTWPL